MNSSTFRLHCRLHIPISKFADSLQRKPILHPLRLRRIVVKVSDETRRGPFGKKNSKEEVRNAVVLVRSLHDGTSHLHDVA
jgi:hypothetical protein